MQRAITRINVVKPMDLTDEMLLHELNAIQKIPKLVV